jgi:hypothetical protein
MQVQTKTYIDVATRSRELGHRVPVGIALLPGNFSTAAHAGQFCYHAATPHVRSAWKSAGLEDEGPEARESVELGTKDLELGTSLVPVALVVFFGADLLAGPPWRLTVALGMVSSVFASHSRRTGQREVRLDLVVERPARRGCARIEYRGDAFGIVALAREVRRIWTDE